MTGDIYVLVPGITGSVLEKDGKDVFGLTASAGLRALFSGGNSIQDLRVDSTALPGERPDDGVRASRVAADAHLIPGLWKIDGYSKVVDYILKRMRVKPGESFFEFPYDWRLDNRIAATDLRDRVSKWLATRRATHPDAKVILVAHSMGGLVSRYFLEVLGGWRDTRALVTFGTPHRGTPVALDVLSNGISKVFGLVNLSDLVRSFPSMYQLLPIYRCIDTGKKELVYLTDAGTQIPNLDMQAVQAARAFHQEIEDAVYANRQLDGYIQTGYRLHGVIGIEHPTSQSGGVSGGGITMLKSHESIDHGGDGTVPRVSASPMEAEDDSQSMFAGTRHASLQNADAVLTQLRGWIDRVDLRNFRAGGPVRFSVDLQDVYPSDEPIHVTVTPSAATTEIRYQLEHLASPSMEGLGNALMPPTAPERGSIPAMDGPSDLEIKSPGPGLYRLTLSGTAEVEPVSDLLVVAPR